MTSKPPDPSLVYALLASEWAALEWVADPANLDDLPLVMDSFFSWSLEERQRSPQRFSGDVKINKGSIRSMHNAACILQERLDLSIPPANTLCLVPHLHSWNLLWPALCLLVHPSDPTYTEDYLRIVGSNWLVERYALLTQLVEMRKSLKIQVADRGELNDLIYTV